LASWTTQIRGDFLALVFSLLSIYLFLHTNGRWQSTGASVCAGIALLVKQTFLAAPVAIIIWLIYKRRYKDAAFWAAGVALTVVGGYAVVLWREPLMLKHITALRYPVFEYHGALRILLQAALQPSVLFAALGGFLALWERPTERVFFLIFCVVAWLVAILTIPQIGGNINYFWEPLLASAVLAGSGLWELQRRRYRTPILVIGMFLVVLLWSLLSVRYLGQSYQQVRSYELRKARWESFVSIVSGRRLLSTWPDVTILSSSPEIPDPYLNSVLEFRGRWSSAPVVAEINASRYDLIVIREGQASMYRGYRGVRHWSEEMWSAMKRTYRLACVFESMEIWLPRQDFGEVLPSAVLQKQLCNAALREQTSENLHISPNMLAPIRIDGSVFTATEKQ
jgi:hypothetical protein